MAEDTNHSKGIVVSATPNNMEPLPGISTIDVGIDSESKLSSFTEDPRRNHSSKHVENQTYSDNNARTNAIYLDNPVLSTTRPISAVTDINRTSLSVAKSGQGHALSMAQHAQSFGIVPNMNVNRQRMYGFEASLNAVEVINNANLSRLRSQTLYPDLNPSFSNTNGFAYNYHQRFPVDFVSQLPQRTNRGSLALLEDNLLPLHTRESERNYSGRQSRLTEGAVGDAARTMTLGDNEIMMKRRRVEDRITSDLSITKRARNSVQLNDLALQQQGLLNSDSWGQLQWGNVSGRSYSMYAEKDAKSLSHYQCLVRKQIEIFEATSVDACTNAQGRNRPILPGQIGIRCRHCYKIPLKQRKTGSVYYPNRVSSNMLN